MKSICIWLLKTLGFEDIKLRTHIDNKTTKFFSLKVGDDNIFEPKNLLTFPVTFNADVVDSLLKVSKDLGYFCLFCLHTNH